MGLSIPPYIIVIFVWQKQKKWLHKCICEKCYTGMNRSKNLKKKELRAKPFSVLARTTK